MEELLDYDNLVRRQLIIDIEIDCNEYKKIGIVASAKWKNSPNTSGIAILEIIPYSNDWLIQRFTFLKIGGDKAIYMRTYHSGTTWTPWCCFQGNY